MKVTTGKLPEIHGKKFWKQSGKVGVPEGVHHVRQFNVDVSVAYSIT